MNTQVLAMLPYFLISFLGIVVLILFSSCVPKWKKRLKYRNLPPGPFNWPLLGYVPAFDLYNGYKSLKMCADKYGGVFSIYIGWKYTVVIHDWEALKSSYNREEFLGKEFASFPLSHDKRQTSIGDVEGNDWKEQKKFFLNSLRILAMRSKDFSSITMSQIADVISNLKKKQGVDVNIDHEVELALNNVTYQLFFGKTYDQDHPFIKLLGHYDEHVKTFITFLLVKDMFPWAGKIVNLLPAYRKNIEVLEQMDNMIRQEVREHQQTLNESDPRDFVDLYLLQMQKPENNEIFNDHTLLGNLKFQLLASSETTRNTLVWFVLLMAKHPEIQEQIQKQLDSIMGREREPLASDKPDLPLLEAAILETLRVRHISHVTPPRSIMRDTTLCGYDIPKGTIVFFAMTSHLKNPDLWRNPEDYDPFRFLSSDKKKVVVPEFFIPFSYGKRNCPGERVANSNLFLFSASLLQRFRILPPEGGVNLDIKINLNNGQAHPFARFQWRE